MASAAHELITKMPSMSPTEYLAFAAKLDESQIVYPSTFCVQALLIVARGKQAGGTMAADAINDMFSLSSNTPQKTTHTLFKAAAPRLQNIVPLCSADVEKLLTEGLIGTVMLGHMALADGVPTATAAAETLRDACACAASFWPTSRSSIVADPSLPGSRSPALPAEGGWITELKDVAEALLCVATGPSTPESMDTLLRVQEARSGSRRLLGNALKQAPWVNMCRDAWKYGIGSCTVLPKISEALQACTVDPAAWMKAATLVPAWKPEVRPGTTTALEEMLWRVLLTDWENLDMEDQPSVSELLCRLSLARKLFAPNRPGPDILDSMEKTAPCPQLFMPASSCWPWLQPRVSEVCGRTLVHDLCCLS